jgi:hypothetical protein
MSTQIPVVTGKTIIIPAATARFIPATALRDFLAQFDCRLENNHVDDNVFVMPPRLSSPRRCT